jgi:hypothetical protein
MIRRPGAGAQALAALADPLSAHLGRNGHDRALNGAPAPAWWRAEQPREVHRPIATDKVVLFIVRPRPRAAQLRRLVEHFRRPPITRSVPP